MLILVAKCQNRVIHFPLRENLGEINAGSMPENAIYLPFKGISRTHFVLFHKDSQWFVRDLKSTNGTYLNGNRVEEAPIKRGDTIRSGVVEMLVKGNQDVLVPIQASDRNVDWKATGTDELGSASSAQQPIYSLLKLIFPPGFIIGTAPAMLPVYQKISSIVDSDVHVMLVGETGVGKEMFARTLHLSGKRSQGPFIEINCAAIPVDLAETELFGIGEKIATDVVARKGKMALADRGTLFLDELSAFPSALQAKILRAIEDKLIYPVGEHRPIHSDFRVVSATNEEPRDLLSSGKLRTDLYHRLATVEIVLPPLRERKEDLEGLISVLLQQIATKENKVIPGMNKRLLTTLTQYSYPGNMRELLNILRAMVALAHPGEILDTHLLPERFLNDLGDEEMDDVVQISLKGPMNLQKTLDETARRVIVRALHLQDGNISSAAEVLGVTPFGLRKMMKRLGVTK